jgi:RHS repeat-associated protein
MAVILPNQGHSGAPRRSNRGGRLGRRLGGAALTAMLALAALVALPSVSQATPKASQASEVYVAVGGSTPEVQAVDSTTGGVIDTVALAGSASSLAEYDTSGSAPSQVVAVESGGLQEVSPSKGTASSVLSLSGTPSAVAIANVSPTIQEALVLVPSADEVAVVNLVGFSLVGYLSLGFSSGSPAGIAANPSGSNAYVTDSTSHQVATLQYITTGVNWQVENTYSGGSTFSPTSVVVDPAYNVAIFSDGQNLDESSLSTGVVVAPYNVVNVVCATGGTAGALTLSGGSGNVLAQQLGADYVADVSLVTPYPVTCLPTTFAPGPVALTQDGGTLAVPSSSSSTLDLLSTAGTSAGTLDSSVSLDATATAITPATDLSLDTVAFVAERQNNLVAMVDLTTGIIDQTVTVGSTPGAVAVSPDGQFVYVANNGSGTVSVIQVNLMDTTSNPNVATITLPSGAVPHSLVVSPNGDQLLVVDGVIGAVTVIDTNPADVSTYRTVTNTVCVDGSTAPCTDTFGPTAIAISPDGSRAYVLDGGPNDVTVLDQSAGTYTYQAKQTSLFTGTPQGIAISPNDQSAYVTDAPSTGNGNLRTFAINPTNGLLVAGTSVTVGQNPIGVSLSPNGGSAYVLNGNSATVSVVNTTSGSTTSVSVPATARAVGVKPDGSDFIATSSSTTSPLSIYSTATNAPASPPTIALGSSVGPYGVAVDPLYNRPSGGSLAGYENDRNPSVAASGNVDMANGVNTATGAYTFNKDDLSLPDIGLGLDFSQEYDSASNSVNGPLGYGWSFSYGMSLTQVAATGGGTACDITVTQQNGAPVVFYPPTFTGSICPSSGYQPATFEQASLRPVTCYGSETCWDMTSDGATQYLFNQSGGRLQLEQDANGNTVSLTYTGANLSAVTGQSGARQLSFIWTGTNITKVTDSAGRTATFAYTGAGNLQSVTLSGSSTGDPTSHEWAFSYSSPHRLSTWWSPDNQGSSSAEATRITYNSAGEVTEVQDPSWLTQCNGASGTPVCTPTTTFSYPSYDTSTDTGTVVVSDPNENYDQSSSINNGDGNVTLDSYADGTLLSQVKGFGYETDNSSPYTHYPMDSAVTASIPDPYTWLPATSVDADGNLTTTSYDASGNVIQSVDPMGRTTSSVYNVFNEVLQTSDPMGYVTSSTYDAEGNKLTDTNANGDLTSYAYNSSGEKCAMLNGNGHVAGDSLTSCPSGTAPYVTSYAYDGEGDQKSVTTYDGTGNTVSNTYVTTSLYNGAGELCASLTADGHAAGDSLPGSCPSSGAPYETAATAFDVFGNVLSSISPTNAPGGTTATTYDADGNKLTTTDPASDVTTSTYDPDDQLCWSEPLSVISPTCSSSPTGTGTQTTTYSYDPNGHQLSSVAPDGNNAGPACLYTTSSSFDNLGNTLSTTTPAGGTTCANETTSTTSYAYDPNGNTLTAVSPPPPGETGNVTTTSAYDGDGELCWSDMAVLSSASCASPPTGSGTETTSYSYNADGRQTSVIPPNGNVTSSPSNYQTTTTYDASGNTLSETVPPPSGSGPGETTTNYYDASSNKVAVTGQNGNPATCNPLTNSSCADTTYNVYDEQSRELITTDPSSNETAYTDDADAAMLTTTQQSGTAGTYTYNGAGELTQISYTDGTPTVSYQYGANGKRCWMFQGTSTASCASPPTGAATYSYDSSSRLTSETNSAGATDTYGYDSSSNLSCVSYPNAAGHTCSSTGTPTGVVRYTYNQTNQLSSLTDWAGNTLTFTYSGHGEQCWVSTYAPATPSCGSPPHQSGAVTTKYGYDALGNVSDAKTTTGAGPTNLLDLSVGSRDATYNITAATPTVATTAKNTDSYGYNDTNQVSSGPITGTTGSTAYAYSPLGSTTADTTAFGSAGYTTAGALCWTYTGTSSNACSSPPTGATTYSTNSDGERTGLTPSSGNSASYGWETDSNLLICANTSGTSCSTSSPTATTTVYTYDGDGLRTSAMIGSTTTNFTWGTTGGNSQLLSDGTWDYVYVPGGAAPIEQIATTGSSPTSDLLLSDESQNVRGLVQLSSGTHQNQLVNYTDYDAYGNPITQSGGSAEGSGLTTPQTSLNSNYVGSTPWGFGEGYTDSTGLIYLIKRYYDPVAAQFLSVDPDMGTTQEPYLYAGDNPVLLSDPTGLYAICKLSIANPHGSKHVGGTVNVVATTACTSWVWQNTMTIKLYKKGYWGNYLQSQNSQTKDHVTQWTINTAVVCDAGTTKSYFWGAASGLITHSDGTQATASVESPSEPIDCGTTKDG